MNKVILKSALITVAAVIVAALIVFSMWILCSPQTMATSCERTGNYSFAITCAEMRYNRTNDVNDLARCAEDGILSGKDEHIVKYCETLTLHEDFKTLCKEKDEALSGNGYGKYRLSYNGYISGHLAAAQYRTGDIGKAVKTAESGGVQSFSKLVIEIAERKDKPSAQSVIAALEGLEQTEQSENLIIILKKIA